MGGRGDYGGIYLVIIAPLCSSDQNSLLALRQTTQGTGIPYVIRALN